MERITVLPLTLVELEQLAKGTMAVLAMMVVVLGRLRQVGAAAQGRLVLRESLPVPVLAEQAYPTASVVPRCIMPVVVAVVRRILRRVSRPGLVETVEAGPEGRAITLHPTHPQTELPARLTGVAAAAAVGVVLATQRRAARAVPESSLLAIRCRSARLTQQFRQARAR